MDVVTELANGGTDTLDFSEVTSNLTFHIKNPTGVDGGFWVNPDSVSGDRLVGQIVGSTAKGVKYVEQVTGGTGTNTYKVFADWGKDVVIDNPLTGHAVLDLSAIPATTNLTITIAAPDSAHANAYNKVTVTEYKDGKLKKSVKNRLVVHHVYDIRGGLFLILFSLFNSVWICAAVTPSTEMEPVDFPPQASLKLPARASCQIFCVLL